EPSEGSRDFLHALPARDRRVRAGRVLAVHRGSSAPIASSRILKAFEPPVRGGRTELGGRPGPRAELSEPGSGADPGRRPARGRPAACPRTVLPIAPVSHGPPRLGARFRKKLGFPYRKGGKDLRSVLGPTPR